MKQEKETIEIVPIDRKKGASLRLMAESRDADGHTYRVGQSYRIYKDEEPPAHDPQLIIWFADNLPKFVYDYDPKNAEHLKFIKILSENMLVDAPGNKYLKKPTFKMNNLRDQKKFEAIALKKKGAALNKLNSMSGKEIRDVAFRYGINAKDKQVVDLFVDLGDFSRGLVMSDQGSPSMIDNFLALELNKEFEYMVIAKKAIIFSIFTKERNGFYYFNSTQVGNSDEDVMKYCKDNTQMYETFVKPEVEKRDALPVDVDYSKTVESIMNDYYDMPPTKNVENQKIEVDIKRNELLEKAKELGIRIADNISNEDIEKKINNKLNPPKKEEVVKKKEEVSEVKQPVVVAEVIVDDAKKVETAFENASKDEDDPPF